MATLIVPLTCPRSLPGRPLPESGPTRQLIGTFKRSPKTSEMGGNSPLIFDNESRLRSLVCRRSKGRRIAAARIGPSKEKSLDSGAPVTPVLTRRRHEGFCSASATHSAAVFMA